MESNKGFFYWLVEPIINILKPYEEIPEPKPFQNIELKTNTKLFRPQTFFEYIGQERIKEILQSYIKATKKRNKIFPHTLIHGKSGCGKTTLAKIISNELKLNFKELIATEIKDGYDFICQIEQVPNGVLFVDEIHSLERNTCESIYSIMEDFSYNGETVPEFTMIGATTEIGELIKSRKPFIERFKLLLPEMEDYTEKEISIIAEQYFDNTFPDEELGDEIYDIIGKNSRLTPRTAIRLVETILYFEKNTDKVLKNFQIIKDSYTEKDLKLLQYLSQNPKGIGLEGILCYLNTSKENYMYEIEPWLVKNNLILRTRSGRKITKIGTEKIEELKKEKY